MARVLLIEEVDVYRRGLLDILCRHFIVEYCKAAPTDAFDVTVLSTSSPTPPSLRTIALQLSAPVVAVSEEGEWRLNGES